MMFSYTNLLQSALMTVNAELNTNIEISQVPHFPFVSTIVVYKDLYFNINHNYIQSHTAL